MDAPISRPRVFLDIHLGAEPLGRLVVELFTDKAPKTCENFIALCTGSKPPLTYKMSRFHRIIDEFMVQGGDITKGDGTGGESIYGSEFEDENIGWREIDVSGLVCMANRGKDTNSSQFFITLAPCQHLNAKHTVFGHLVSNQNVLFRMASIPVDKSDRPTVDVLISHCGELERRTKLPGAPAPGGLVRNSTVERGRRKRRRSSANGSTATSRSRSASPSRGHTRHSASRHRHHHRKHHRHSSSDSISPPANRGPGHRRRSDASPDHNLRGRPRLRSKSPRQRSPIAEYGENGSTDDRPRTRDEYRERDGHDIRGPRLHGRRRSPPPSRHDSPEQDGADDDSAAHRRQRSLPNQYRGGAGREDRWARNGRGGNRVDEEALRREEWERERGRFDDWGSEGRLGGGGSWGDEGRLGGGGEPAVPGDGIIYKGRGSMKYRERRW